MAWIRKVPESEARGPLAESYAAARKRAGRVYEIVQAMSLSPRILDASMRLYLEILRGPSGLTRAQRELLAVVVSRVNLCHY